MFFCGKDDMARPSSYDQNKPYLQLADEYLATCGREQTKLPKVSEFCREYIGVTDETVELWIKGENLPEGADTTELIASIKRIKDAQKEELQDDGLFGGKEVNNAMAIFLLKANHGMIETIRKELVGKDGQPLQFSFKVDLAGGYIPQVGSAFTAPASSYQESASVQDTGVAQTSKENDNSANGTDKTGSV